VKPRLMLVNRAADPVLVAGLAASAVEIINTPEPDGTTQLFFAALLMDSLHSPWDYPGGRINPRPASTSVPAGFSLEELNNFLYADYAIGKFIRDTRGAGYFDNTLFVFVGDHGVHLRGQNLVRIDEYRVPALFLAPAHLEAKQIRVVISQIDLPQTIMGIVGGDYRNLFLAVMR
jgi:phosphoglycerol transferase MdoB-like AlkP superfamily enzyme